jgi:hypothetical protein
LPPLAASLHLAADAVRAPRSESGIGHVAAFYPLDGGLILQVDSRFALLDLDEGGFVENVPLAKAVGSDRTAFMFFGAWPKAVFAQLMDNAESSPNYQQGALYQYEAGRFKLIKKTETNVYYEGAYYPGDGRLGGLVWLYRDGASSTWVEILEGSTKGPLPVPATLDDGELRIGLHIMLALPTGHLFTYGPDNGTRTEDPAVERWEPGQSRSVIERPPTEAGTGVGSARLVGRGPADVYLCGVQHTQGGNAPSSLYLARFDGKAWTAVSTPPPVSDVRWSRCAITPDGAIWFSVVGDDGRATLYRRAPDGSWAASPFPAPPTKEGWSYALDMVATASDDVWVMLENGDDPEHVVVFRTKPAGAVLRWPGRG